MQTRDQLEAAWADLPEMPRGKGGVVRHIVARKAPGVHEVLETAELSPAEGLHGDRWKEDDGDPEYQITMMNVHVARLIRATEDQPLHTPGDNLLVDFDLSEQALPVGTRVRVGEVLLEVSAEPHLGCKKFRERFGVDALAWVNDKSHRDRRLRGVNCKIIEAGFISVGDDIRTV